MLIAILLTTFPGSIVWGHHMFIVGFDIDTRTYSTTATSITAIPTGIKILNRIATLWSGSFYLITPLSFIIGFLFSFSFGGFTGPIPANSIIDTPLHDPYFVIGHSHYALSPGAVYTIFAAFYNYRIPLSSYFSLNDFLGRCHYFTSSLSPNLISFPMHSLGINGFPRRIFDYPIIYFKFHWFNTFGLLGVTLSQPFFLGSFLFNLLFFIYYFTSCSCNFGILLISMLLSITLF